MPSLTPLAPGVYELHVPSDGSHHTINPQLGVGPIREDGRSLPNVVVAKGSAVEPVSSCIGGPHHQPDPGDRATTMTNKHKASVASLLALLLTSCSAPPANSATVLSVGDGDTIRVSQAGETLTARLGCIDASETSQRPWGQQARQQLQALLPVGSQVELRIQGTDRYRRTVAEVLKDGRNINLQMVGTGQAMAYRQFLKGCDAGEYLAAERQAQAQRLGIWGNPRLPMAPWDYRRCRRAGGCR
jgi:endonuclease YncB( thermonuclease family)